MTWGRRFRAAAPTSSTVVRGRVHRAARRDPLDRIAWQHGPNGMVGSVPIGPDLAYLFHTTTADRDARIEQSEVDRVLRQHLKPFGGLTGRVRDEFLTAPYPIVCLPEDWLIAPPPWGRGRIVLIGDAARGHPAPRPGRGAGDRVRSRARGMPRCRREHRRRVRALHGTPVRALQAHRGVLGAVRGVRDGSHLPL
ncbi:hypothetical protein GCM10023108_22420 [Saccharopolyspora hordei]